MHTLTVSWSSHTDAETSRYKGLRRSHGLSVDGTPAMLDSADGAFPRRRDHGGFEEQLRHVVRIATDALQRLVDSTSSPRDAGAAFVAMVGNDLRTQIVLES